MSELEALYGLLKRAYDAGFTRGNQFDNGCTPEGFGEFQEFWDRLGGGDITSALADMMDRSEPEQPDLQPGVQIPFRQGDYVVMQVHHDGSRTTVEMQDFVSWNRDHMVQAVPSVADWGLRRGQSVSFAPGATCPRTGCFLPAMHMGQHEGEPA